MVWDYSIIPKSKVDGPQKIVARVEFRWDPIDDNLSPKQEVIWREQRDIVVERPWIKMGQVQILGGSVLVIIVGLAGLVYQIFQDKKREHRELEKRMEE